MSAKPGLSRQADDFARSRQFWLQLLDFSLSGRECPMQSCSEAATRHGRRNLRCVRRPLRVVTYLAPNLFWFYKFISAHLAKTLGYPTELVVGSDYAQLAGHADIAFVCGLP